MVIVVSYAGKVFFIGSTVINQALEVIEANYRARPHRTCNGAVCRFSLTPVEMNSNKDLDMVSLRSAIADIMGIDVDKLKVYHEEAIVRVPDSYLPKDGPNFSVQA